VAEVELEVLVRHHPNEVGPVVARHGRRVVRVHQRLDADEQGRLGEPRYEPPEPTSRAGAGAAAGSASASDPNGPWSWGKNSSQAPRTPSRLATSSDPPRPSPKPRPVRAANRSDTRRKAASMPSSRRYDPSRSSLIIRSSAA